MRWVRLSSDEKRLVFSTAVLFLRMRLALRIYPFETVRRLAERLGGPEPQGPDAERRPIAQIQWAIETAARHIPGNTCLPRALVALTLFRRNGYRAQLHIGVRRDPDSGRLDAHAWVDVDGNVITGGLSNISTFVPLTVTDR